MSIEAVGAAGSALGGIGSLFGGGGGSQHSGSAGYQHPSMWVDAQPGARQFYDFMRQLLNQGPSYFPGETFAGPTGATKGGWRTGLGAADAQDALFGRAMPAWESALTAPDLERNPYVKDMRRSTRRQFGRSLAEALPRVATGAQLAGGVGGSRQALAEALMTRDMHQSLGEALNELNLGAYSEGLGARTAALGMGGLMDEMATAGSRTRRQIGAEQQMQKQGQIDADVERFNYYRDYPMMLAQFFSQAYAPMAPTGPKGMDETWAHSKQKGGGLFG